MLNRKTEKIIFIIIYIVIFIITAWFATLIKANYLPINIDLTPEQVIKSEFEEIDRANLNYNYIIIDNFLITCVESASGYNTVRVAFKNNISGFMFDLPGTQVGSVFEHKYTNMVLDDGSVLVTTILQYKSKYIILIQDPFNNRDIKMYVNNEPLDSFTPKSSKDASWAAVLTDLTSEKEFYCVFGEKTYYIIDNLEIKKLFGE